MLKEYFERGNLIGMNEGKTINAIAILQDDDYLFPHQSDLVKESVNDVKVSEDMTCEQKTTLIDLLKTNSHIFTDLPGETNLANHSITLINNIPLRSKPYKVSYAKRDTLKSELAKMLEFGIIKEYAYIYYILG